jgi:hypothetical protein
VEDHRIVCVAQASGIFAYRVQHRLNLGRRVRDDAQHFSGRSLLLQGLAQLARERFDVFLARV